MKKILVTGCNGQLGRAIRAAYAGGDVVIIGTDTSVPATAGTDVAGTDVAGTDVAGTSAAETGASGANVVAYLDITDSAAVMGLARRERPDVIINCAAHTNVDACEREWDAAYRINAIGPRNLAIAASEIGAKLVHVSTDYVFAGDADRPYTEFDAPSPISAYGKTKLAGEEFVRAFSSRYFIFRTAWLYGEGKNFVRTMLALSETHGEVSVVCDQLGSPTSAAELSRAIRHFEPTEEYGTYHATCEGSTNWADFAEAIFARAGRDTRVRHVTSEEYAAEHPDAARRPAYSILDNYMMRLSGSYRMAGWEAALDEYLA